VIGYTGSQGQPGGYTGSIGYSGSVGVGYTGSGGLPSQTGNSGKYLTTDGTAASWASIATTTASRSFTMSVLFGGN
jgi:hypothetical protein